MAAKFIVHGLVALTFATVTPVVQADITAEQVRESIRRGVTFLKGHQDKVHGNWPEYQTQPGGLTALCTLALINSGEDPKDPSIQRALQYLRGIEPSMTYSVALQTMVFCAAEPKKDRLLIRRNVTWLENAQIKSNQGGRRVGSWAYSNSQGRGDNSNTQFALLALNEAERVGVQVSDKSWNLSLTYWRADQQPDGSWGYYRDQQSTGSMTCAGIGALVIASGNVQRNSSQIKGNQVLCCGQIIEDEDWFRIERGLRWLDNRFSVRTNPGERAYLLYYLYGVERVGRLTGRRFIGDHDWYREGAEMLVVEQDKLNGYWRGVGHAESNPLVGTPLALLFLSKGRRPVVMAKVKYGQGEGWDPHRGGVPKLTRRVEQSWLQELSWQTVNLQTSTVEDLAESPVLFLAGRDAINFTAEQKESLVEYVNQGGFIFIDGGDGNGCDGSAFDKSIRKALKEMFPDSPLRLLPPDHAVWFAEEKVDPKHMRRLEGIEACCRTSVIYCPSNLSCFWDLSTGLRENNYPDEVQAEIEASIKIGKNVLAYATNRILKEKLDPPDVSLSQPEWTSAERGVLYLAKLRHSGGSDDAPNALNRLLRFVQEEIDIRVAPAHRMVAGTDPKLYEYPILFMHGRRSFRLSPAERAALATYVENGGFLFVDSICASEEFSKAFRREMAAIFPEQNLARIPPDHVMFSADYGGDDLSRVTLNDPKLRGRNDRLEARRTQVTPLLEGLEIDGRLAVVFSPYDLSCALESRATLECKGYIRRDAARIGMNVILFALNQ